MSIFTKHGEWSKLQGLRNEVIELENKTNLDNIYKNRLKFAPYFVFPILMITPCIQSLEKLK